MGKLNIHMQRIKLNSFLTPHTKVNSKQRFKVISETIKLLEENISSKVLEIIHVNDILDLTPKGKNRHKNQVPLLQTKKLLYNKGNCQQNEKPTYRMGENIYKSCLIRD